MARTRIPVIIASVVLGIVAVGGLGVLAVDKYQQLYAVPTDPPAARGIVQFPPPLADEETAAKRSELFRQHVASAEYTEEDSADLATGNWREAAEAVTHISGDAIHRRVAIRTDLEPGDTGKANLIAAVFPLWQSGNVGDPVQGASPAEWPDHGVVSVYAGDDTLLVANVDF